LGGMWALLIVRGDSFLPVRLLKVELLLLLLLWFDDHIRIRLSDDDIDED
jgi:hypothetical protein